MAHLYNSSRIGGSRDNRTEKICSTSLIHRDAPWLTLSVKSAQTASTSSGTIPLYEAPGSAVKGEIVLMLDRLEAIQTVKVSLRGISSLKNDETSRQNGPEPILSNRHTFMDVTETLWTSKEGIPQFSELSSCGLPKDGKLRGKFTFHFTLHLPQVLALESSHHNDPRRTYELPRSWTSKTSPASIDYDVCVTVVRGALKTNTM